MRIAGGISRVLLRLQTTGVRRIRPRIVRSFSHDSRAFTQGLTFVDGALYESTGSWQKSSLRRLDTATGSVLELLPVANDFAEGIAALNGRLYQLTWTSGRVLYYSLDPLSYLGEGRLRHQGWGLAVDAGRLAVTDGTSLIRFYDPELNCISTLGVSRYGLPVRRLNAMAIVAGSAYINLWYSNLIARIDLASGNLIQLVDCSNLMAIECPDDPHKILNGIAYHGGTGTFYVTGKCWRTMFEVDLGT